MSTDGSKKTIFKRVLRGKELLYVKRDGEKRLLTGSFFTGGLLTGGTGADTDVLTALERTPDAFVSTVKNRYQYVAKYNTGDEPEPVVSEFEETSYDVFDINVDHEDKRYKPEADHSFDLSKERAGHVWDIAYKKAKGKEEEILDAGYGWVTGYKDGESLGPENIRDRGDYYVSLGGKGSKWDASCSGGRYKGAAGEASCVLFADGGSQWVVFAEMAAGANVHGRLTVKVDFSFYNQHHQEGSPAYPREIEIPIKATVITMPGKFTNELYPEGTKAVVDQTMEKLGTVKVTGEDGDYEGSLIIEDFVFQIPESKFVRVVIQDKLDPNECMQKYCFGHPAGKSASYFNSWVSCNVKTDYEFIQVGDTPQ